MPLERVYQARVIKKIRNLFPGCIVLKNDSGYQQGILDWSIFYGPHWAMLEIKRQRPRGPEDFEPNQEYFLELANEMSFAACIYPENEIEVLSELQQAFQPRRSPRVSKSKSIPLDSLHR